MLPHRLYAIVAAPTAGMEVGGGMGGGKGGVGVRLACVDQLGNGGFDVGLLMLGRRWAPRGGVPAAPAARRDPPLTSTIIIRPRPPGPGASGAERGAP